MELVDIVNERNEVVGQIDKDEAHTNGALHRCIISELIDSKGNWTLVKQASSRQDGNKYVSPVGGHVQSGESEEDALKRETLEEIGIHVTSFKLVGRAIFNREVIGRRENHYCAMYEVYSDELPTLNHESVGFETFSREQLKSELKDNPEKFGDAFYFAMKNFYPDLE